MNADGSHLTQNAQDTDVHPPEPRQAAFSIAKDSAIRAIRLAAYYRVSHVQRA